MAYQYDLARQPPDRPLEFDYQALPLPPDQSESLAFLVLKGGSCSSDKHRQHQNRKQDLQTHNQLRWS
jgi:hypothetical protein